MRKNRYLILQLWAAFLCIMCLPLISAEREYNAGTIENNTFIVSNYRFTGSLNETAYDTKPESLSVGVGEVCSIEVTPTTHLTYDNIYDFVQNVVINIEHTGGGSTQSVVFTYIDGTTGQVSSGGGSFSYINKSFPNPNQDKVVTNILVNSTSNVYGYIGCTNETTINSKNNTIDATMYNNNLSISDGTYGTDLNDNLDNSIQLNSTNYINLSNNSIWQAQNLSISYWINISSLGENNASLLCKSIGELCIKRNESEDNLHLVVDGLNDTLLSPNITLIQ